MENTECNNPFHRKFSWMRKPIFIPIAIIFAVAVFGYSVMFLWNAILPSVLGVATVTFWQAVGILVLSKILFGGFHHGHHHRGFHPHNAEMRKKWKSLSQEEKKKMMNEWWNRFEATDCENK